MRPIWFSPRRRAEIALGWGLAFKISTHGDNRTLGFYIHIIGIAIFFRVPWPWIDYTTKERDWGFTVHDWAFWWSFAEPSMEWHSKDPWWKRFTIHFDNVLFGRSKCTRVEGEERQMMVPMPEGSYPAVAQKTTLTWRRTRLPFWKRTRVDWTLDIPKGIPFMGKGENSWDCGDDGLWGIGGDTPEKAVGNAVAAVLEQRRRHGETSETKGRVILARSANG